MRARARMRASARVRACARTCARMRIKNNIIFSKNLLKNSEKSDKKYFLVKNFFKKIMRARTRTRAHARARVAQGQYLNGTLFQRVWSNVHYLIL